MSKFISVNELDSFEFHDAVFTCVELTYTDMIWTLDAVNVTTKNSQNNSACDMQADSMKVTFYNSKITHIELWGYETHDCNGNIIDQQPNTVVYQKDFKKYILKIVSEQGCLFAGSKIEGESLSYSFDVNLNAEIFTMDISYSKAIAECDNFEGKAWYVNVKLSNHATKNSKHHL